jgi:hypothetical protein
MGYFREHEVQHDHNTRHKSNTITPVWCRTQMCKKGPFQMCIAIYNKLQNDIKCIENIGLFKRKLTDFLICESFYDLETFFSHKICT